MHRVSTLFAITAFVVAVGLVPRLVVPDVHARSTAAVQWQTRTFTVEKMTCPACPITVRAAMRGVEGVREVKVDLDGRTATVTFDPGITTPDDIAAASARAGYPARPDAG